MTVTHWQKWPGAQAYKYSRREVDPVGAKKKKNLKSKKKISFFTYFPPDYRLLEGGSFLYLCLFAKEIVLEGRVSSIPPFLTSRPLTSSTLRWDSTGSSSHIKNNPPKTTNADTHPLHASGPLSRIWYFEDHLHRRNLWTVRCITFLKINMALTSFYLSKERRYFKRIFTTNSF